MRRLLRRFWYLVRQRQIEADLAEEMEGHRALMRQELQERGADGTEAWFAARRAFGNLTLAQEEARGVWIWPWLESVWQDTAYAVRTMRRQPGFTAVAVLTLALGIGANATIFTLLDAVVFKPLPIPAAHELVTLYESPDPAARSTPSGSDAAPDASGGTGRYLRFSYPRFEELERAVGSHGSLAAVTRSSRFAARLAGRLQAQPVRAQLVSGRYFTTLGVSAAQGRLLTEDDVRLDKVEPVAVISDGFWRRSLGAAHGTIGQTIVMNGVNVTVIGITPPGFSGIWTDAGSDIWLPLTLQHAVHYGNNVSTHGNADRSQPWLAQDAITWLNIIGRVPPTDLPQVRALLETSNRHAVTALAGTLSDDRSRRSMLAHTLTVEPFSRGFSGLRTRFRDALFALAAMVAVVLLVTCANIANLLLARAMGHARNIGIRLSLGATPGRLIRQCLTESIVLAGLGGAAGLLAGNWASGFLARQVLGTSGELPPAFSPDARVLAFSAGLSITTAILFGLAPALRAIRLGRASTLGMNQRQVIGLSSMNVMRPLIVGQLALSVVVVYAAVLLGQTLINFTRLDPGFAVDRLVTASIDPNASGYSRDQMTALGQRVVAAVLGVPGVTSAAVSTCGLVASCSQSSGFRIEDAGEGISLNDNWVGPGYFATVGIPLVSGREFDERDTVRGARVAVISESIARRYFPGQNPIGKRLGIFLQLDTEIVGVVRDARSLTLHDSPVSMVYFPINQPPPFRTYPNSLDVRVTGDAGRAVGTIRDALRSAEPGLIVDNVSTMSVHLARDVGRERIVAYLASGFAVLALFLASLGLYGVLSYAVARRTQEIGVRIALGARRSQVMGLVLHQSFGLTIVGLVGGLAGAAAATPYLRGLLFGVAPLDATTFIAVPCVFALVVTIASYLPARRATRVDPLVALRSD